MSSIDRLLTDSLVIRRMKTISGYRMGFQATSTADGRVEDMDSQRAHLGGYIVGQTFVGWIDDSAEVVPKVGDQITDGDNRIYKVMEVNLRNMGINGHYEIILSRLNPKEREG